MSLAVIPHVQTPQQHHLLPGHTRVQQGQHGFPVQLGKGRGEVLTLQTFDEALPGACHLEAQGARQQAEGRHHTGGHGEDDPRDAQLSRDTHGLHRAGPAEGHHGGVPVIEAALRCMHAKRPGHVLVDDLVDAEGRPGHVQFQRRGDVRVDGVSCRIHVEAHAPAQEEVRVQVSQHQVGVRERGRAASTPVARRAGVGTGAVWAHADGAAGIDAGDAAAARADLDHVDDGSLEWQAAARLELVLAGHLHGVDLERGAVAHQGALGGGATHVE